MSTMSFPGLALGVEMSGYDVPDKEAAISGDETRREGVDIT